MAGGSGAGNETMVDRDRYSSMAAKKREDRERFTYQDLVEITSFGESIL